MDGEGFIDYKRMINEVNRILLQHPKIVVVDCDLGLIKAIKAQGEVAKRIHNYLPLAYIEQCYYLLPQ